MLIVGTIAHLEDIDRSYTYAEDVSVTALAVGAFAGGVGSLLPSSPRPVWSILDRERIVQLEEFDVAPLVRLPTATAQSLAVSPGGSLVVGMEGAHLLTVSPDGVVGELSSFDEVSGEIRGRTRRPRCRTCGRSRSRAGTSGSPVCTSAAFGDPRTAVNPGRTSSRPKPTSTKSSPETADVSPSPRRLVSGGARTAATRGSGRPTACTPAIREPSHWTATRLSHRFDRPRDDRRPPLQMPPRRLARAVCRRPSRVLPLQSRLRIGRGIGRPGRPRHAQRSCLPVQATAVRPGASRPTGCGPSASCVSADGAASPAKIGRGDRLVGLRFEGSRGERDRGRTAANQCR